MTQRELDPKKPIGTRRLMGSRVVLRGSALNLAGFVIPALTALLCIPPLIRTLGEERFGVLALAWTVVGYFSLFDFGLGRGLTQIVSERLGSNRQHEVAPIARFTLLMMVGLGICGALIADLTATAAIRYWPIGTESLANEMPWVIHLMSASLVIVILNAGLNGLLAAHQRFDLLNMVRVPVGVGLFLGPLVAAKINPHLGYAVAAMLAIRLAGTLVNFLLCRTMLRKSADIGQLDWRSIIRQVVGQSSWITVTNIISPLMVTADRLLVGMVISLAAVTYYVVPYELATKLWVGTSIVLPVLFPVFAASHLNHSDQVRRIFSQAVRGMFLLMFPAALLLVLFGPEILHIWLGPSYVETSSDMLRIFTIGVFINCLAQVPFALLQGTGLARIPAIIHLSMALPYVLLAYWLLSQFGLTAAAWLWTSRAMLDTVLLFIMARRFSVIQVSRLNVLVVISTLAVLASVCLIPIWRPMKIAVIATFLPIFMLTGWRYILHSNERTALIKMITAKLRKPAETQPEKRL